MKMKMIVAILAIAAVPGWGHAQSAITNEDAQQLIDTISSDKEKTQAYCDVIKLGDQLEHADQTGTNTQELKRQMAELEQKLGPEYAALMAAFQNVDLNTRTGLETGATVQATIEVLNQLCGTDVRRSGRD